METNINTEKPKRGRPRKISDLDQVDGKVRDTEAVTVASIDILMGTTKANPFRTNSKAEYTARLREMNLSDMQRHAENVRVPFHWDRQTLLERLLKAFCDYHDLEQATAAQTPRKNDITALSADVRKILAEGA